jgi:hypothetical protein
LTFASYPTDQQIAARASNESKSSSKEMLFMKPSERPTTGAALAITAAAMFSLASVNAVASEKAGTCHGANSCKGQSACHTATTSCAGQNACKGQGWIKATKSECEAAGGEFEA